MQTCDYKKRPISNLELALKSDFLQHQLIRFLIHEHSNFTRTICRFMCTNSQIRNYMSKYFVLCGKFKIHELKGKPVNLIRYLIITDNVPVHKEMVPRGLTCLEFDHGFSNRINLGALP